MSLKKVLNVLKDNDGIVKPALDKYLLTIGDDEDRRHGYNSPSGVSSCSRSIYYTRTNTKGDGTIDPRTRRIFDNGHGVHARLQGYLEDQGMLLLAETPVWDWDLLILGHCDGIIRINKFTLGILEIKSINSNAFSHLTTAKEEHQMQAQVYMMCLERLREILVDGTEDYQDYIVTKQGLLNDYGHLMESFVVSGSKFTKEEKIAYKLSIMEKVMDILYETPKRIDTMSVVYENKDNQELKEFVIKWDDSLVQHIVGKYTDINEAVEKGKIPSRPLEATSKSCQFCRYCNYQLQCWR